MGEEPTEPVETNTMEDKPEVVSEEVDVDVDLVAENIEPASSSSDDELVKKETVTANTPHEDELNSFWQRQFKRMARTAWAHLGGSLFVAILLSVIGMMFGGFEATVDNAGWQSRGTLIADRQTQLQMTKTFSWDLFTQGSEYWEDLQNNVQPGWESGSFGDDRRRLTVSSNFDQVSNSHSHLQGNDRRFPFHIPQRLLQNSIDLEGCDVSWYNDTDRLQGETRLWPVWRAEIPDSTILDPAVLLDMCIAEANTQAIIEEKGLCFGCEDGCLPPYSLVLYARLVVPGGFDMECSELSDEWNQYQAETEVQWAECVADTKEQYDPAMENSNPESCPQGFSTTFVDETFDTVPTLTYTSSIYATYESDIEELYDIVDQFDRGSEKILAAYDSQYEDFNVLFSDAAVARDMALACGSAVITTTAMIIHTKSPFITGIGLLQIILSFPLAFFVYTFIGGLDFFPFLNFIGVFVVFALGADNIFVATDKWKNARLEYPTASVQYIAAVALPDAAGAMFLTTLTTAIAFFGTAICPVAPIKMFAIFCGLLIMFDYILCVLLVFPALCVYGNRLADGTSRCCNSCNMCRKKKEGDEAEADEVEADEAEAEEKSSFIRTTLLRFYEILHKFRWALLVLCAVGFGVSIFVATTLELPVSADVRILDEDIQFEQNYLWRQNLLYSVLEKSGGSSVMVGFGLIPADTGDLNNPDEWSQLVLDDTFDPASTASQEFMLEFCDELFDQNFADVTSPDFVCPFKGFNDWVEFNGNTTGSASSAYTSNCGRATSVPVPEENFHDCIIAYSQEVSDDRILSNEGKLRIVWFQYKTSVRFDSPFDDLDLEWNAMNDWFNSIFSDAPTGVGKAFFSNADFWWYDTNGQMLTTAYGAAAIALGAAALVILFSSQSFRLTIFAVLTIGYVLASVTASLVGFGWTLGFLESICFAILIGVSVDFVIHFTHSYAHLRGEYSRADRTKHALMKMGPSILAAAFTTISAAVIMLFTVITFFQKFALILFMTIIQATIGSFVVFLTMTDCLGPNNPTALVDSAIEKCRKKESDEETHHA